MKPKFNIALWREDVENIKKICLECERLGYDGFFYGEGLGPESFTVLSYLAGITKRIRLGPGICFLTYRHPVLLAKIGATLDNISRGRFDLRLGAGAIPSYGIAKPPAATRVRRLGEGLRIIRQLWKEGKMTTTKGKEYKIEGAVCDPRPVQKPSIPITIAAKGKRMIQLTSKFSDVWEGYYPPNAYIKKSTLLEKYQQSKKRSKTIEKSLMLRVFMAANDRDAKDMMKRYMIRRGISSERLRRSKYRDAIGSPDQCLKKIHEFMDLGVSRFTILMGDVERVKPLMEFQEKVVRNLA